MRLTHSTHAKLLRSDRIASIGAVGSYMFLFRGPRARMLRNQGKIGRTTSTQQRSLLTKKTHIQAIE